MDAIKKMLSKRIERVRSSAMEVDYMIKKLQICPNISSTAEDLIMNIKLRQKEGRVPTKSMIRRLNKEFNKYTEGYCDQKRT